MLEKIDLNKKMSKQEYSESLPKIEAELGRLQRECKDLGIPVMIVFEGFGASGKGLQIGKLIHSMDPRGFEVHTIKNETEEERMHPFLWRFWIKTPEKGRIAVFDGSWYRKVWVDRFEKRTQEKELKDYFASINAFEQQLSEGGTLIIKLFLDIDQDEQKKRFKKLEKKKETQWRVTQGDKERNVKYDEYDGRYLQYSPQLAGQAAAPCKGRGHLRSIKSAWHNSPFPFLVYTPNLETVLKSRSFFQGQFKIRAVYWCYTR